MIGKEDVNSPKSRSLIVSLPKSGTHLATSILDKLACLEPQKIVLNRKLRWHPMNYSPFGDKRKCFIGVDQPQEVRLSTLYYMLNQLKTGCYTSGHIPYQESVEDLLQHLDIRTFFVIRDPRDIVVSLIFYVMRHRSHFLHRDYQRLSSDKERLITAIRGLKRANGTFKAQSIANKLEITRGWLTSKLTFPLQFEELVGEQGGGNTDIQRKKIMMMANHIGICIDEEQASSIGKEAFGQGSTFRQGKIGSWRAIFDNEVKDTFKKEAGEYLIRMGYETDDSWY